MPDGYTEIETLEHGGVRCTITRRTSNLGIPQYSYKFFRVYIVDGAERMTPWLNPSHAGAVAELTDMVVDSIRKEQSDGH